MSSRLVQTLSFLGVSFFETTQGKEKEAIDMLRAFRR